MELRKAYIPYPAMLVQKIFEKQLSKYNFTLEIW